MDLGNGLGHLTYSTLVHPADDWEKLYHSLVTYLPRVKARIAGNKSFGVCIRLSANTAQTLAACPFNVTLVSHRPTCQTRASVSQLPLTMALPSSTTKT